MHMLPLTNSLYLTKFVIFLKLVDLGRGWWLELMLAGFLVMEMVVSPLKRWGFHHSSSCKEQFCWLGGGLKPIYRTTECFSSKLEEGYTHPEGDRGK